MHSHILPYIFQQRVRDWRRLELKHPNPSLSQNVDGWSPGICETDNWDLWRRENGFVICQIRFWQNLKSEKSPLMSNSLRLISKFKIPPFMMIVNFLFCDAYFHEKQRGIGQFFICASIGQSSICGHFYNLAILTKWARFLSLSGGVDHRSFSSFHHLAVNHIDWYICYAWNTNQIFEQCLILVEC